jgi:hypothetical protein
MASANARSVEDLLVEFRQCGAQCLGMVLDGAHVGLRAIELGIGGSGHGQPLGGGALFRNHRFGHAEPVGQLLPRHLLLPQRIPETLDRAELTLEKCHGHAPRESDPPPNQPVDPMREN